MTTVWVVSTGIYYEESPSAVYSDKGAADAVAEAINATGYSAFVTELVIDKPLDTSEYKPMPGYMGVPETPPPPGAFTVSTGSVLPVEASDLSALVGMWPK